MQLATTTARIKAKRAEARAAKKKNRIKKTHDEIQ